MTLHIYRTVAECDYDLSTGTYTNCGKPEKGTPFIGAVMSPENLHGSELSVLILLCLILIINILLAVALAVLIYISLRNWYNKQTISMSMPTNARLQSTTCHDEFSHVESGKVTETRTAEQRGNCDGGTQHPPLTHKNSSSTADLIANMETV